MEELPRLFKDPQADRYLLFSPYLPSHLLQHSYRAGHSRLFHSEAYESRHRQIILDKWLFRRRPRRSPQKCASDQRPDARTGRSEKRGSAEAVEVRLEVPNLYLSLYFACCIPVLIHYGEHQTIHAPATCCCDIREKLSKKVLSFHVISYGSLSRFLCIFVSCSCLRRCHDRRTNRAIGNMSRLYTKRRRRSSYFLLRKHPKR